MYALIYPLKNIRFDREIIDLSGNKAAELQLGIINSNSFSSKRNPLWEYIESKTWWREQLGTISLRQISEMPFFYFLFSDDYMNGEENEKSIERGNFNCSIATDFITRSFFDGCWIVKDSCVFSQPHYIFDLKRNFLSRFYSSHFPSKSNGLMSMVSFGMDELENALMWMNIIISHDVWKKQSKDLTPEVIDYESHSNSLERRISEKGSSYYRAFVKLERARMSGMITEKLDKYCSLLECFFAINQSHKNNVSNITAVLMEKEGYNFHEVKKTVRHAYSIRSDCSHGDDIQYLKNHSLEEMVDLSKQMDDYSRQVFRYMLRHPEYDYDRDELNKKKVRESFLKLASNTNR